MSNTHGPIRCRALTAAAALTATVVALAGSAVPDSFAAGPRDVRAAAGAPGTAEAVARPRTVDRRWQGYPIASNGRADGGWLGGRRIEQRVRVYRIDPLAADVQSSFGKARVIRALSRQGRRIPARSLARTAWVLSTYGSYPLPAQAAAVDAVTYHLLVGRRWRVKQSRGSQRISQGSYPSYTRRYVRLMLKQSAQLAGPYYTMLRATPTVPGGETDVTLRVTSAKRKPVPGRRVVLRFGTQRKLRTTGEDGTVHAAFDVKDSGVATVIARVGGLAQWRLFVRRPARKKASRVVVAGRHFVKVVRAEVDIAGLQTLALKNARSVYSTSQPIGGRWTLHGHGGARNATVSIFGPFGSGAKSGCVGTPAASQTQVVDQDAVFDLPGAPVLHVGYYRYAVTVDGNAANTAASICGDPFRVRAIPTVSIKPARSPIQAGQGVIGKVSVSGLQATSKLAVRARLYGPFAKAAYADCETKHLFTTRKRQVAKDGTYNTTPISPSGRAGKPPVWYVWTAQLSGGEFSTAAASRCRASGSFLKVFPH